MAKIVGYIAASLDGSIAVPTRTQTGLPGLSGLSFSYLGGTTVLNGVNLSVEAGDTIGLVGESGSGKSTLLRLMLGLQWPDSGTISFDGTTRDPRSARFMHSYRRQVQVVFQDPYSSIDPRQTVFSIVAEPLRSLRIAGDHRQMVANASSRQAQNTIQQVVTHTNSPAANANASQSPVLSWPGRDYFWRMRR